MRKSSGYLALFLLLACPLVCRIGGLLAGMLPVPAAQVAAECGCCSHESDAPQSPGESSGSAPCFCSPYFSHDHKSVDSAATLILADAGFAWAGSHGPGPAQHERAVIVRQAGPPPGSRCAIGDALPLLI